MSMKKDIINLFDKILLKIPNEKELDFLIQNNFSLKKIERDLKKLKNFSVIHPDKNVFNFNSWEKFCYSNTYVFDNLKKEPLHKSNINLVFIDFRILSCFEFIIKNAIYRVGNKCMMTFVCGYNNFSFVKRVCNKISSNIKILKLNKNFFSLEDYNSILLDKDFWYKLEGEKILIHQFDAFIFKNNIENFIEYDYIGAPWENSQHGYYVGNGGFSLRNKNLMIQILEQYELENLFEDIFFSKIITNNKLGKIATLEEAKKFSRENIYFDSFGGHKFWQCQDVTIDNLNIKFEKDEYTYSSKDYHRQLCKNNINLIRKIELPLPSKNTDKEAFLIEFREMHHLEFLIRNAIIKFPSWKHSVICGNLNYKSILNLKLPINIIKLDIDNTNQKEYNNLLLTPEFWNFFEGEKLLLYQEDSIIFHNKIDRFLQYDFIGSPWPLRQNDNKHNVGNGGFSLRSKSKLLECLKKIKPDKLELGSSTIDYMKNVGLKIPPEDVFYTKTMIDYDIGKVAKYEEGRKFSQESILGVNPLGGHHYWMPGKYPPLFKNYKLKDDAFFKEVTHRGGWKKIINEMFLNNILSDKGNVLFLDMTEKYFIWDEMSPIIDDWIGILHLTHNVPPYLNILEIDNLLENKNFNISLKNCLGLIVMSKYMKKYLENRLENNIYYVKHPTDLSIKKFDFNQFKQEKWRLLQLGQQLRFLTTIYTIKSPYKKIWLPGSNDLIKMKKLAREESIWLNINIYLDSVDIVYTHSYKEYDDLITKNIVIINLINASANNSILELIASETPFFINRILPVEEYVGKNYPMFFDNISEVEEILQNKDKMLTLYQTTHNYLQKLDKKDISLDHFFSELLKIIN